MLNRRHLRIKALQSLYAFFSSNNDDVARGEKELLKSINTSKDLFVWQLSLIQELHYFAVRRAEDAKQKFYPTEEDLNPNLRFVNNRFIIQLENNRDFKNLIDKYHVSWIENTEAIRRLYNSVKNSDGYAAYLQSDDNYINDKNFVIDIYTNFVFDDDFLLDLYETKNIYWYTDFFITQYVIVKFFDDYQESFDADLKLPDMIKPSQSKDLEDDEKFVLELFRNTIRERDRCNELIKSKIINWDMERISNMDILILDMALSELLAFPSIPIKVTLNEYIEISKMFSSPKSKIFINGILDSLVEQLKKSGDINKVGRGLM